MPIWWGAAVAARRAPGVPGPRALDGRGLPRDHGRRPDPPAPSTSMSHRPPRLARAPSSSPGLSTPGAPSTRGEPSTTRPSPVVASASTTVPGMSRRQVAGQGRLLSLRTVPVLPPRKSSRAPLSVLLGLNRLSRSVEGSLVSVIHCVAVLTGT